MTSTYDYSLPNELWLEIFQLATSTTTTKSDADSGSTIYTPFQPSPREINVNLKVKRALVQVCRLWRRLTTEILYRDVRVGRGQTALKCALGNSEHEAYGPMVRRIELPYQSTSTVSCRSSPLTSVEILRLCDHLETLVRPRLQQFEAVPFEYDADCIPLPSLKRLEWWQNNEAERSGGINSLGDVLLSAPNLRYLFIGNTAATSSTFDARPICLPELQTLRLHAITGTLLNQMSFRWSLPSLTHVVIDTPPLQVTNGLSFLWESYGPQLQSVEFGRNLRFLMTDVLTPCLKGCPNLKELNYYILFTTALDPGMDHPNLTNVGLHFSRSEIFDDENQMWDLIEQHFDNFIGGESFPSLKTIRVFGDRCVGDWDDLFCHARFAPLEEGLRARGCGLEL